MKRRIWPAVWLLALCLLTLPARAADTYAARPLNEREQTIYGFLTGELGLSRPAACGVLGNMWCESSLDPTSSRTDVNGEISFGLCQWNGGRYRGLRDWCAAQGLDSGSVEGQLRFLQYELQNGERAVLPRLQGLGDDLEGAYTAGVRWARYYERCWSGYYDARGRKAADYWMAVCGDSSVRALFFDAAGGSTPVALKGVTAGEVCGALPTPAWEGGVFLGWFTAREGGERVTEASRADFPGGRVLYAHWNRAESFVERLYKVCLDRAADPGGLAAWSGQLRTGAMSGAEAVGGFFGSAEYRARTRSDEQFVEDLYRAMLDRGPDASGLATWLGQLRSGRSRCRVCSQICRSGEFRNLCAAYGLTAGTIGESAYDMGGSGGAPDPGAPGDREAIRAFVTRLYERCLGREPEAAGLETWTRQLTAGGWSGRQVAGGFVFSAEYTARNAGDGEFVTMLYDTLLDRLADSGGYATWTGCLERGESRAWVFERFCESAEFRTLCARYGIRAA